MVSFAGLAVMRLPATVARLRICGADLPARACQGERILDDQWAGNALVVRHERPDAEKTVFFPDVAQPLYPAEVDYAQLAPEGRFADAALQLQQEVRAAGKNAGICSVLCLELQCLLQRSGRYIEPIHVIYFPGPSSKLGRNATAPGFAPVLGPA